MSKSVWVWAYFPFTKKAYLTRRALLEKRVGMACDGSGTDGCQYDMSWTFPSLTAARRAIKILKQVSFVSSIRQVEKAS